MDIKARSVWSFCVGVILMGSSVAPCSPLKIGTFNLLHDFPKFHRVADRLQIAADEIRRQDLDIVALQEAAWIPGVGNVAQKIADILGYNCVYYKLELDHRFFGFENGIAIISRFPVKETERFRFKKQKGIFERRSIIRALIEAPQGLINFYSVHLSGDTEALNLEQAQEAVAFIQRHPISGPSFLGGDFNFGQYVSGPGYFKDTMGYADATSSLIGQSANTCCVCIEKNYFNGFDDCPVAPQLPFTEPNDHIFLIPGMVTQARVISAKLLLENPAYIDGNDNYLWASDHVGVQALIGFSGPSGGP